MQETNSRWRRWSVVPWEERRAKPVAGTAEPPQRDEELHSAHSLPNTPGNLQRAEQVFPTSSKSSGSNRLRPGEAVVELFRLGCSPPLSRGGYQADH